MREALLEILCCPTCQGRLVATVARAQNEDIEEGSLSCIRCDNVYPVTGGVPRLLKAVRDARTAASFGFEWTTVEVTDFAEDVVTFFKKTGLDDRVYAGLPKWETAYQTLDDLAFVPDGSFLAGKRVLDAGCGMGRYLNVAGQYAAEVVGLDFSQSVDRTVQLVRGQEHVQVVQGDIFALPFPDDTFDYVYSIDCIHHTPDPAAAFRSLAATCRPGGSVAAHVYPPEFWLDPIRGLITRALRSVTVRLPHRVLLALCKRVALPLGTLQMWFAAHPVRRLLGTPLFVVTIPRHRKRGVIVGDTFDTYSARYIWTFTSAEVSAWFHRAGFEAVEAMPYPTTVKGRKGAHAL